MHKPFPVPAVQAACRPCPILYEDGNHIQKRKGNDAKIGKYAISEYGDGSAVIWNDDLQDMCYSFFGDDGFTDEEAREKLKDVTWTDAILIHVGLPE